MPKTIITKEICKKAKNGLIKLKSHGTAANKLKAIIAAYSHGSKKVSYYFNLKTPTLPTNPQNNFIS